MLKSARISVGLVFLIHGIVSGSWLARIPAIQQSLHLSNAELGFTLLAASAGAGFTMFWISRLIRRVGSAAVSKWSSFAFCLIVPAPAFASNGFLLATALFLYGVLACAMDVGMNTQAVDVERLYERPIMVGFHALFSLGGLIGAAIGGFAAAHHMGPAAHLSGIAVVMFLVTFYAIQNLLADPPEVAASMGVAKFPLRPLLALGVISFCILLGEGAMADWSAVYLTQFAGQGTAATGYAVFSLAMAAGRFGGDYLRARLGSVRLVRVGSLLAAIGLAIGLTLGGVAAGLFGFFCAGAGFSSIFPIALSAAGRKAMPRPEAGIATVTAVGYVAFLAGPPAIGVLSEWVSLRDALFLVSALSLVCTFLAGFVREAD